MATRRNIVTSKGEVLADPDPSWNIEDVRQFYASSTHPELTNAVVIYHEPVDGVQQYELGAKAGTASASTPKASAKGTYELKESIGRKA